VSVTQQAADAKPPLEFVLKYVPGESVVWRMHALPGKDVRGMTRVEARRLSVAGSRRTRTRQNDHLYSECATGPAVPATGGPE
jgi:hypothetical protein